MWFPKLPKRIKKNKKKAEDLGYNPKIFVIKKGVLKKYRGKTAEVIIPDGVVNIGEEAFEDCRSMTSLIIPEGVLEIEEEAFENCKNLTSISFPQTLCSIRKEAFEDCISLISIVIPRNVEFIGREAFSGFKKTQTIIIDGGESQTKGFSANWTRGCAANIIFRAEH